MTSTEDKIERVERLLSLRMDGRLDDTGERELDELLSSSEEAREIERSLLDLRETMRAEPAPTVPAGLEQRVLDRVSAARRAGSHGGEVIRLVRAFSAAAAVVLGVALFTLVAAGDGGEVGAGGTDPNEPTIEDELREGTDEDGSIQEFLRGRITGKAR